MHPFVKTLVVALIVLGAGAGFGAVTVIRDAVKSPEPTVQSCADLEKQRPDTVWVQLHDCQPELEKALVKTVGGLPVEGFVPMMSSGGLPYVVLATRDTTVLMASRDGASDAQLAQAVELLGSGKVSGMVRHSVDLQESDRRQILSLSPELSHDFIIVDDGRRPQPLSYGLGLAGFSLLALGLGSFLIVRAVRRARRSPLTS